MKRWLLPVVFASLLVLFPVGKADATEPLENDTRPCISKKEFRVAVTGWSQRRTAQEFEVEGLGQVLPWWPDAVIWPRCDAPFNMYDLGNGFYGFSFAPGQGLWWRIECLRPDTPDSLPCYTGYNKGIRPRVS